ncbi:unnamed protein product [Effrenium voratum]|nr:unnamed protein product [Effrenium voratum]CAJ1450458.1 unnamed protein product [Effrenium voratum]
MCKPARMYQRQLWDPCCAGVDDAEVQEWHFHRYGAIGIFMFDLRGSRIDPTGHRRSGPLVSAKQRKAVEDVFQTPGLRCILLCSEVPFVWERPAVIQTKARRLGFLKDHWPYNLEDLTWLLDLCFAWKAASASREIVLLGGDLHVSMYSAAPRWSALDGARCVTTSPVSNRVGSFYAHHAGKLNSRLSAECSSRADAFLVCLSPRDTVLITLPMEDWPFFAAGGLPRDLRG